MSRPRVAGWYPDPSDPALLRHWNGEDWDERSRHLPGWVIASDELDLADFEGPPAVAPDSPYRGGSLPALTAPGPVGASHRRRPTPPLGVWRPPPPATYSALDGAGGNAGRRRSGTSARRRGLALLVVAALLVLSVSGAVAGSLTPSSNPLAPDTAFLRKANSACVTTLGGVRPVASGPADTSPAAVQAAQTDLAGLSRSILRLSEAPGATSVISGWLHLWQVWATARLAEAREAAAGYGPVPTSAPGSEGAEAQAAAAEADSFAVHHGLYDCSLEYQPTSAILPVP
jgi:hypothetical protein